MLNIIEHNDIVEISMARPPVNAMTREFLDALTQARHDVVANGARAIVLSGREGLFSAGLDVPTLIEMPREGIEEFWSAFFNTMKIFATCPVPVAAAITGHAPAGGTVLSLYCDYRVATRGDYSLGLNEVRVGLPVTRNVLFALEALVGARKASLLATAGEVLSPEQALNCGLVDDPADAGEAQQMCLNWASNLLALPPVAMNKTRLAAKAELIEKFAETSAIVRLATDAWFSDETQRMLKQLVASLKK
jgi:3,2-trans-enoyl-CoA isomerase